MKKIATFIFALILNATIVSIAQEDLVHLDINVTTPGSMGDSILAHVENFSDVQSLRLTGKLNDDDIYTLKNRLNSLIELDLQGLDWPAIPESQFRDKLSLKRIVLPYNLISIGNNAFYNCQSLQNILFSETLQSIGECAFYLAFDSADIIIPEGVISIGRSAFQGARLKSVVLPSTLKIIRNRTFQDCGSLVSVSMNGQTIIETYSFKGCRSLKSIKMPKSLETIGEYAFEGYHYWGKNDGLENVILNEGLINLWNFAFYYHRNLKSIELPSTIQVCGERIFDQCDSLKLITSLAIVPPHTINNITLYNRNNITLQVPSLSVNVYKQSAGWDDFNIQGISQLPNNIVITSDYKLNWPDSIGNNYKPDILITSADWGYNNWQKKMYGSLSVQGNSTLSIRNFSMFYDLYWQYYYWNTPEAQKTSGSLINNGVMRADTVQLQMILPNNRWCFVVLPYDVKVRDIRMPNGDVPFVVRKYDGEKRAAGETGATWVNMTADSTLHAGQGYIWQTAVNEALFVLPSMQTINKNNLFANKNVETPLAYYESEFEHNRSWNLVGNPYPCYYDIRAIQTTAPITVWNIYNSNYEAYSPADDQYVLRPGQAFFVQRPVNEESMTFLKEGRQINNNIRDITYFSSTRKMATKNQRSVFNLLLKGNETSDRTRIVINEGAQIGYESARDASKFFSIEPSTPQLYTLQDCVRYAINERPLAEGIIPLGLQLSQSGLYTIVLDAKVQNEVTLIDHFADKEVRLDNNAEGYSFISDSGTFDARFTIRMGNGDLTGITEGSNSLVEDHSYYNLHGIRVTQPQKGVYLKEGKKIIMK